MCRNGLYTVAETAAMIEAGCILLLAGEEDLLAALPAGQWIGGTTVHFMTATGGIMDRDHIFVTDITHHARCAIIQRYSADTLPSIAQDYLRPGFSVMIAPAGSEVHTRFAKEVPTYTDVFGSPLLGWISGVDASDTGARQAKVFAGSPDPLSNEAVVLHVALPPGKAANLEFINLFTPGDGGTIMFPREGFISEGDCRIDGKPANLARYIAEHNIDTKLPLIADYHGIMANASIRTADVETGVVCFYAPVFPDVEYTFARPVPDYMHAFERYADIEGTAFSCNCLLNFIYAGLDGKTTGNFQGPVTYGEIAYMLLNQTLVYLTVTDIG